MFCDVWITFVVGCLHMWFGDDTFGYVGCDSCIETHNTLQIITETSKIVGSGLTPFVRRYFGHLVLNRALHYVWLRLRYVSITVESTLQIPGKRGPVKYGTDP